MDNKFDTIVVHYDEIGLKGKNRPVFENILARNIKFRLGKLIGPYKREGC